MKHDVREYIPAFVWRDLGLVRSRLSPAIEHYGLFGSILHKGIDNINDIDVLWVYSGRTFAEICTSLRDLKVELPFVCSYMNYSNKIAPPPDADQYFHFIFMPKYRPNREFLARHEGKILYLSPPFDSWRAQGQYASPVVAYQPQCAMIQ